MRRRSERGHGHLQAAVTRSVGHAVRVLAGEPPTTTEVVLGFSLCRGLREPESIVLRRSRLSPFGKCSVSPCAKMTGPRRGVCAGAWEWPHTFAARVDIAGRAPALGCRVDGDSSGAPPRSCVARRGCLFLWQAVGAAESSGVLPAQYHPIGLGPRADLFEVRVSARSS